MPKTCISVGAIALAASVAILVAAGLKRVSDERAEREFAEKAVELFVKAAEYAARPSTNEIPAQARSRQD